jgi:type IV pilus assembly protein PilA
MLDRMRQRTSDEGGFTLIELLVVVLIIGILAAIAIPAFLSQTSKANDSAAKTQVGTQQTTMETYASENNGSFAGAELSKLQEIEPTLKDTSTATAQAVGKATATEFEVSSIAKGTENTYVLLDKNGEVTRSCEVKSESTPGGCKLTGGKGTKGTW